MNPAYTSFIGKIALMRGHGLSVHEAASWAIGLRALKMEPKIPERYHAFLPKTYPEGVAGDPEKEYRHCLKTLMKKLKGIRTHAFYLEIPAFETKKGLSQWLEANDRTAPSAA